MPRNPGTDSATATAERDDLTDGEQPQGEAQGEQATDAQAPEGEAKPKRAARNTYTMPVTVPTALHNLLIERAKNDNKNATQMVREVLAGYVNYTLPITEARPARRKFASKEEATRFRKERNQKAKALLAALDSGDVSEETLAKYLAAMKGSNGTEGEQPAEAAAATA